MLNNYKKRYIGIITILILGYFFLYNYSSTLNGIRFCLFRNVTGISCPACGSTRATIELLHGNIIESILITPISIFTNQLIVTSIFWMIVDIVKGKETFLPFLKKKWNPKIFFVILLFITVNWIWIIRKEL